MSRRVLISAVIAVALLVGVGGVLYVFGTPERPEPVHATSSQEPAATPAEAAGSAPAQGEAIAQEPAADTAQIAQGEVPPPDPSVPLAIEIPGCVCHSDDPKIVEEHAEYRMNQCAGCHAGGVPTGQ